MIYMNDYTVTNWHNDIEPEIQKKEPAFDMNLLKKLEAGTLVAIRTYSNNYANMINNNGYAYLVHNQNSSTPTYTTSHNIIASNYGHYSGGSVTTSNVTMPYGGGSNLTANNIGSATSFGNYVKANVPTGVTNINIPISVDKSRYAYGFDEVEYLYPNDADHIEGPDNDLFYPKQNEVVLESKDGLPLFGVLLEDAIVPYEKDGTGIIGIRKHLKVLVEEKTVYFSVREIMLADNDKSRQDAIDVNNAKSYIY